MKTVWNWNFKISELYVIPSIVLYKNHNEHIRWFSIRVNWILSELEVNFYYGSKNA